MCLLGYYCNYDSHEPQDCPVGHYCDFNSEYPTACPRGTYNPYTNMGQLNDCLPCQAGYTCADEGFTITATSKVKIELNSSNVQGVAEIATHSSIEATPYAGGPSRLTARSSSCSTIPGLGEDGPRVHAQAGR